ncbi:LacI family transcriptional regulator, partial [Micromonospora sp. 15K316]|uniref:LacI family DNA-binding transcriptional regulator n=1 Tax=Micromonospora sp. 15K316 TaxID=2530376 RepID=UPI00104ECA95
MPKPGSRLRLVDVAERAGVSLATASRALSGRDGVSEEVADRVRRVSQELGYVANPYARTLAGGASSTVGLVVHQVDDPYFSEIAGGVIEVAAERGLLVQICHSGRDPHFELRQIRHLIAQRVGIIVIAGSGYTDARVEAETKAELSAYQGLGGRVAVIGRHSLGADAVLPDNEAGGRALAEHLLALGHRRIAVAAGTPGLTTVADRLAGVASALRGHGLDLADLPVVHTDFTR